MQSVHSVRKPAHLEIVGGKGKRQRMWEAIRARRSLFTRLDIACDANVEIGATKTYLQALENGGFIEELNPERGSQDDKLYRLNRDIGLEAPRLTRTGQPVMQGTAQEQMWRTMRILRHDFNYQELASFASTDTVVVAPTAAKDYLKHLARAGYVTVATKGKGRGAGGIPSRYRFNPSHYTGPRPPMVQRTKSIYDPNLGQVVWQEEIDHDDL